MDNNMHRLIRFFREMASLGFDLDLPQQWGFYFLDEEKGGLLKMLKELRGSGYQKKSLQMNEKGFWLLCVSKIEILTPDQLLKLNNQFTNLIRYHDIEYFGGWDVRAAGSGEPAPYLFQKNNRRAASILF